MSGPTVASYSQPTPHLLSLLSSRLPNSLPLLRRLQFTRFPGGVTEHSRILYAGASALSETTADDYAGAVPTDAPFAAAYVDLSRGPETEVYFYSSLESLTGTPSPEQIREAGDHASALLKSVRAVRDEYDAGGATKRAQAPVLIGTLSETVRTLLLARGFVCTYCTIWDKWIFRLDGLPDAALARVDAAMEKQGLRWGKIVREDTGLVISRTKIPRTEQTDAGPTAFHGHQVGGWHAYRPLTDHSLVFTAKSSGRFCSKHQLQLSINDQAYLKESLTLGVAVYRGQGFAKAVAIKLMQDHLKDYGGDDYCAADVAPDNAQSQGVCRSLGGNIMWTVSWSVDSNPFFFW
ncbi:hypothetical protein SCAR479_12715 [Seiridium cardinale]|uniref:N-acetyltransferase domain-containing protein n=1 Tax=Seiridium cardinale TaxID=138064 RepID=A0ABR2XA53_9PEZI